MRVLDTRTGLFRWVEDPKKTPYAILSHVWFRPPGGEKSFQDVLRVQEEVRADREKDPTLPEDEVLRRLPPKIRDSCAQALKDGFDIIWIDSCCIDKTSSAELSEAINSMYAWYAASTVCYAFLHDVNADEDPRPPRSTFRRSVWFTRGWTLQELIAPTIVILFASDWRVIGGKHGLALVIEETSGIDRAALTNERPLHSFTVAQRMFWASTRVTTRKEDEAYCLMGLFDVNMPTIYGEGDKAFLRLQEEILKTIPDQTIFIWDWTSNSNLPEGYQVHDRRALLAPSPKAFSLHSASVEGLTTSQLTCLLRGGASPANVDSSPGAKSTINLPLTSYMTTSSGILASKLPYLHIQNNVFLVPLAGRNRSRGDRLICLLLERVNPSQELSVYVVGCSRLPHCKAVPTFQRWPEGDSRVGSAMTRLAYLPVSGWQAIAPGKGIGASKFHIAHSPTVIRSMFLAHRPSPSVQPVSSARRPIPYSVRVNSSQLVMRLRDRDHGLLESMGYTLSFAPKNTLNISSEISTISIAFSLSLVTSEGSGDECAASHTLCASYGPSTPGSPNSPRHPSHANSVSSITGGSALKERTTMVEDWDPVPSEPSMRRTFFPLPSLAADTTSRRVRITVTHESPGSPRYPAMFSLALDFPRSTI